MSGVGGGGRGCFGGVCPCLRKLQYKLLAPSTWLVSGFRNPETSDSQQTVLFFNPGIQDAAMLVKCLGWLRDVDLRQQLAAIAVPTLLTHGENDPLMPLPVAQWLKEKLPNAHLELFGSAAHACFLNDPECCAMLIGDI